VFLTCTYHFSSLVQSVSCLFALRTCNDVDDTYFLLFSFKIRFISISLQGSSIHSSRRSFICIHTSFITLIQTLHFITEHICISSNFSFHHTHYKNGATGFLSWFWLFSTILSFILPKLSITLIWNKSYSSLVCTCKVYYIHTLCNLQSLFCIKRLSITFILLKSISDIFLKYDVFLVHDSQTM